MKNSSVHKFHDSLKVGKAGEAALQKLWPELTPLGGKGSDFILPDGTRVEVKSDSYDMNATGNMFIELLSDLDRVKVGGPRQAALHGSTLWVYWFPKNKVAYVFKTEDMVQWLRDNENFYAPIYIKNIRWTTVGIKVPRVTLRHMAEIKDWSTPNE